MNREYSDRGAPSASMAPQITAAFFALTLALMLLFPMVRLSFEGSSQSRLLIHMLRTDFGINIFAWILLLVPVVGIIVGMMARPFWDIASATLALIGVVMVPLSLLALGHETSSAAGVAHVAPGIGVLIFPVILGLLALSTGFAAFRSRRG